jgi:methylase of polypeptide subunit release factors
MSPQLAATVDALRDYLDRVGFQQVYKFLVSVAQYMVAPSLVSQRSAGDTARFFDVRLGDRHELALAKCLLYGRPAGPGELAGELPLAEALLAHGLLSHDHSGAFVPTTRQLIAAFGLNLLIDRRIHFGGDIHQVYIGPDSFWMMYYVDTARIGRNARAVDLCTGTGISALYLSFFTDTVLATDIADEPLALSAINRRLNGRESALDIRREYLADTLDGRERIDVLTCNPPFVAFPPGIDGTLYAQGTDTDGLGYMREIVARLPDVLNPGGSAYLVADLPGDASGPHFLRELDTSSRTGGLAIDAYIDGITAASAQVKALSPYLQRLNPALTVEAIAHQFTDFQRSALRADRYYLTTLRLTKGLGTSGLRVLNRFSQASSESGSTWRKILG